LAFAVRPDTAPPEIIELIDDDRDAFNQQAFNRQAFNRQAADRGASDADGPRWVGPVAAVALVALIAFGVVSSSTSTSTPRAAATATTTSAPATTIPSTTISSTATAVTPPRVPYYLADPGTAFTLLDVRNGLPDPVPSPDDISHQLWATPGSSATSGSWFTVDSYGGVGGEYLADAHRQMVAGVAVAETRTSQGIRIAQFSWNDSHSVTITSLGLTDDQLARLVGSIQIRNASVSFADYCFTDAYQLLTVAPAWLVLQGASSENLYYASLDDPNGGLALSIARLSDSPALNVGDHQTALRFALGALTPFDVGGRPAVAGNLIGTPGSSQATWVDGDLLLSLTGAVALPQLIAAARTVHQVSADEWTAARKLAVLPNGAFPVEQTMGTEHRIAEGSDAAGSQWNIRVSIYTTDAKRYISWQSDDLGVLTAPTDQPRITTQVTGSRASVLADLPHAVAPAAVLHIQPEGLPAVDVAFSDIVPVIDRSFAAYAFSEPVPYTAEIIAADGTILAAWPSP
jgi:hypothetical protein